MKRFLTLVVRFKKKIKDVRNLNRNILNTPLLEKKRGGGVDAYEFSNRLKFLPPFNSNKGKI